MTTIVKQKMTYEEFLNYEDGSDYLYELEDGELINVASENSTNQQIAIFLIIYFAGLGFPSCCLRNKMEIAVPSKSVNVRIPDLVILPGGFARTMLTAKRSLITLDMPAPDLVVEVVSPNQSKRDYEDKRSEYCARGIPEYWIVDPVLQKVTVLELKDGEYKDNVYVGDQSIVSVLLGKLHLTAELLLTGGES